MKNEKRKSKCGWAWIQVKRMKLKLGRRKWNWNQIQSSWRIYDVCAFGSDEEASLDIRFKYISPDQMWLLLFAEFDFTVSFASRHTHNRFICEWSECNHNMTKCVSCNTSHLQANIIESEIETGQMTVPSCARWSWNYIFFCFRALSLSRCLAFTSMSIGAAVPSCWFHCIFFLLSFAGFFGLSIGFDFGRVSFAFRCIFFCVTSDLAFMT